MAWSAEFVELLSSRSRAMGFFLEVVELYDEPNGPYSTGSRRGLADSVRIGVGGPIVQGSALSPRAWTTTIGAFSVPFVGDITELTAAVRRGSFVALYAGFGDDVAQYERIAVGQVRNIRGTAPAWTLECVDVTASLRTRTSNQYGLTELFATLAPDTDLTAGYATGDTTVNVTSSVGFDRETGGSGAIRVTPDTGEDFYLLWSASTATTFTVTAADTMGTTRAAASSGKAVVGVAYLTGHPIDIARKLLVSRGSGTNGAYDTYPSTWGFGLPDWLIDHDDADAFKAIAAVGSGAYAWDWPQDEPVPDGWSWLSGLLAGGGFFVAQRQGSLTVRCAVDLADAEPVTTITDADIVTIREYEAWASDHADEAFGVQVTTDTANVVRGEYGGSTTLYTATLPAVLLASYDLSDRAFVNDGQIAIETANRLRQAAVGVPEAVEIECSGLRLAQLACGDAVLLTTRRVVTLEEGAAGYEERPALVVQVVVAWTGTVRLRLLVYPSNESIFAP